MPKTSTSDEHCCGANYAYVPYNAALAILIFNIFMPGVGTITSAYYEPTGCSYPIVVSGIFQLLLTPVCVGWIWSIVQGVYIFKKAKAYKAELTA